jgi:3-hydroxyacyl-CoA dehydrogenase
MFHADRVGLGRVAARLGEFASAGGDESLRPAPLLAELARSGGTFASFAKAKAA